MRMLTTGPVICRVLLAGLGAVFLHGAAWAASPVDAGGGGGNPAVVPALFTQAQAHAGAKKYADNCEQCHGTKLEGRAGPALTGPNFASAKSNFKVSDIYGFVSQNMPAPAPGSLPAQDYVDIMAFILQQNGYPAGRAKLTEKIATASAVPLVYQGK